RTRAVNLRATARPTAGCARRFSAGTGGRVINMTSGQSIDAMADELSYATTKGAIEILVSASAPTLAQRGITINAIDPGITDTGWIPDAFKTQLIDESAFGRVGQPDDVARLILFLASDAGRWITGQVIHSRGA